MMRPAIMSAGAYHSLAVAHGHEVEHTVVVVLLADAPVGKQFGGEAVDVATLDAVDYHYGEFGRRCLPHASYGCVEAVAHGWRQESVGVRHIAPCIGQVYVGYILYGVYGSPR